MSDSTRTLYLVFTVCGLLLLLGGFCVFDTVGLPEWVGYVAGVVSILVGQQLNYRHKRQQAAAQEATPVG